MRKKFNMEIIQDLSLQEHSLDQKRVSSITTYLEVRNKSDDENYRAGRVLISDKQFN